MMKTTGMKSMHGRSTYTSLLLLLSFLTICAAGKDVYLDLRQQQRGTTYPSLVEVEPGYKLIVTLSENPTTGYRWMVIDQDLKARGLLNIVKLTNESYTTSQPKQGITSFLVGGGGIKTLTFTIIADGAGYLDLYYARIWEIQESLSKNENILSQVSI